MSMDGECMLGLWVILGARTFMSSHLACWCSWETAKRVGAEPIVGMADTGIKAIHHETC